MSSHFSFNDLLAFGIKAIRIAAGLILVIDALAKPFYRPLIKWFASQELVRKAEATVARLPRWAILFLFGIPFIIAEPAKVYAVILLQTETSSVVFCF